jgi:DNA segregation ATPase FtsK/SpoIIIE, S-DNA-T family
VSTDADTAQRVSQPAEQAVHGSDELGQGDGPGEVVMVDPEPAPRTIYATALSVRAADRRPIVPAWMRNRAEARALLTWLARYGAHVSAYHLTRLPLYAVRLARWSPRGLWVVVVALAGWVFDREAAPLRTGAVARGDVAEYMKLTKERNARVRLRGITLAALLLLPLMILAVVWVGRRIGLPEDAPAPGFFPALPTSVSLLVVVLGVAVLGRAGVPRDRRVTTPATVSTSAPPRLTADVVTRALQSLGIAAMSAKTDGISYVAPITRDGPGWRADIDLPFGVTVADVAERRDRLASGLRRPLSAVWPEPVAEQHAGRLVLWVGDQPLNQVKPAAWPLLKSGSVDLLGGDFPFGVDQRQRPVRMSLAETNALVGSLPGGGKTAAVRVLALAAALDVVAEVRIHEHKGSGDLSALEQIAHRYVSGVADAKILATVESMREVAAELERRAEILGRLPRDVVPDSKVTPELARRRGSGLHPLVLIVDEAQEVFSHGDYGDEAAKLAEAIIKRGRALGVIAVFATQRPDAKSLPTGVSTNVGVRFCLRVMDQLANDMVLGTSSYRNGVRATLFTPRDKGIGYLVGVRDEATVVRTYYIDTLDAEKVAARARTAREKAGTITGHAAGEDAPLTPAASLLDDLAVVFARCEQDKVWSEEILRLLAELRPELYAGWGPEQLAAAVKPYGLATGQVWGRTADGDGANRRGLARADVLAAVEQRQKAITC